MVISAMERKLGWVLTGVGKVGVYYGLCGVVREGLVQKVFFVQRPSACH